MANIVAAVATMDIVKDDSAARSKKYGSSGTSPARTKESQVTAACLAAWIDSPRSS
jgi:hypothetical protein